MQHDELVSEVSVRVFEKNLLRSLFKLQQRKVWLLTKVMVWVSGLNDGLNQRQFPNILQEVTETMCHAKRGRDAWIRTLDDLFHYLICWLTIYNKAEIVNLGSMASLATIYVASTSTLFFANEASCEATKYLLLRVCHKVVDGPLPGVTSLMGNEGDSIVPPIPLFTMACLTRHFSLSSTMVCKPSRMGVGNVGCTV